MVKASASFQDNVLNELSVDPLVLEQDICFHQKQGMKLSEEQYLQFFDNLRQNKMWERSINFLIGMEKRQIETTVTMYQIVMDTLARSGKSILILRLRDRMLEKGFKLTLEIYHSLILAYKINKNPERAFQEWRKLLQDGYHPSLELFSVLLSCCQYSKHPELTMEVFNEIKTYYPLPSLSCYDATIHSLLVHGLEKEAHQLLNQIKKEKIEIDRNFMHSMMIAYTKNKQFDKAQHIFKEMLESKEDRLVPNARTYLLLFRIYNENENFAKMDKCYQDFLKTGLEAIPEMFSLLISSARKGNQLQRALFYWKELKSHSIPPDKAIFYPLIEACHNNNEILLAEKFFRQYKNRSFHSNLFRIKLETDYHLPIALTYIRVILREILTTNVPLEDLCIVTSTRFRESSLLLLNNVNDMLLSFEPPLYGIKKLKENSAPLFMIPKKNLLQWKSECGGKFVYDPKRQAVKQTQEINSGSVVPKDLPKANKLT